MPAIQSSDFDVVVMPATHQQRKINLVLVSSVALSFISFWRAAAIVLNDMASTVYYIGGVSAAAICKAAPRVVFGGVVFSFAVRAVYFLKLPLFTPRRGYSVVQQGEGAAVCKW